MHLSSQNVNIKLSVQSISRDFSGSAFFVWSCEKYRRLSKCLKSNCMSILRGVYLENNYKGGAKMDLTSQRLVFRFYEANDFDFLYSMLNDSEMMKYIGNGNTRNTEEALAFLERIQSHYKQNEEFGLKLLVRKEDGIPIGHAGIIPQQIDGKEELEIGYWIAKEFWGNGYATEAAKALLNRAINKLGIHRLISLIQTDNTRSGRVALKNGMQLEKEIILKGKSVSLYTYKSQ